MSSSVFPVAQVVVPQALKVTASHGRLVVSGPGWRVASTLPGAIINARQNCVWLSLTLESLRALRKLAGVSADVFAAWCTPPVVAWARSAAASERIVADVHAKIEAGDFADLPWYDNGNGPYRAPFAHQRVMATVAVALDGAAFICDMGTGKTRSAIEAIQAMLDQNLTDYVCVVCPKGVMSTWSAQWKMWAKSSSPGPVQLRGTVAERIAYLQQLTLRDRVMAQRVLVMNYDVMFRLEEQLTALASKFRLALVPDEMHRVRNPQTKVSKAVMRLATKAKWRLGMTGTPILQGAHDVWSQWYVIDRGITFGANWVQFKNEFFTENEYEHSLDPLDDNSLHEIGLRMRRRGVRFKKADCMDLPPKIYEVADVEMTPQQAAAYRQMEEYLVAELRDAEASGDPLVASAANQLVVILRLSQITSGFVKDEMGGTYCFRPNPKLDALEELVNEQIGEQQIIVWCRYRQDVQAICERLAQHHPRVIAGGVSQADRDAAEQAFAAGTCRLIVGNPGAGGVGINLQAASLAIYYSQGYSLEHRLQSEDRCHRAGSEQHSKVTYIDLLCRDTVDEIVQQALAGKKEVAEIVQDLRRHLGM
jgi:SNF2 family DNA or RNA helicase